MRLSTEYIIIIIMIMCCLFSVL